MPKFDENIAIAEIEAMMIKMFSNLRHIRKAKSLRVLKYYRPRFEALAQRVRDLQKDLEREIALEKKNE